ncbi:MAG: hypothetical protein N2109_10050 [Fimbriimonadales bacterium]|nr:hypothetical protein [Fimbriimonadales bacterium]
MQFNWSKLRNLGVLTATLVGIAAGARAQDPASDVRVDLSLRDADLVMATMLLTKQTGVQFVIVPSDTPFPRITLTLNQATVEDAIRYVCQAAGVHYRRDANGVFVISREKPADPKPVVTQEPAPAPAPRTVKKIRLVRADAKAVYDQVLFGIPESTTLALERAAMARRLRLDKRPEYKNLVRGLERPTYTAIPATQIAPDPTLESGSDIAIPGEESAGQRGGFGGGMGGFGGGLGQGGGIGGGLGQGGGIGGGLGQGGLGGGNSLLGDSIDYLSYDPTDNSLIVRGNEEDIRDLQNWINMFDVAPKQVEVRVEFITTTDQFQKSFGAELNWQRGAIFAGSQPGYFARSADPIFLNYASGNIVARIRAFLQEDRGRVVSAPILRTLNNQYAEVSTSISTWYYEPIVSTTGGAIITQYNPQEINIPTFLSIAPRINDDGTITMFLQPQISELVGFSNGPDGSQNPIISDQYISVVARVKDGETIVLGGLTKKNDSVTIKKFPVLGDLPIIGQFFRGTARNRNNSELLIFVTATVIPDEIATGAVGP